MLKIAAVGDIGIHGRIAAEARGARETLVEGARRLFAGADLVIGNLEIPMAAPGTESSAPATGAAPPETAVLLREWGFTHLSLANNHVMDMGEAGLLYTIERLEAAGLVAFGAGRNVEEAARPVRIDLEPPIALLGYSMRCPGNAGPSSAGGAPFRPADARRTIAELRAEGRAVIVSLHMGRMYLRRPSPSHRRSVEDLLAAGADLVLCHHSHVPAGLATSNGAAAAFGLGEFVFDPHQGEVRTIVGRRSRRVGVLLRAEIEAPGRVRVERGVLWQPATGGPKSHPREMQELRRWDGWDRELRFSNRRYALLYYLAEFPRLFVYVGHAALIHVRHGRWRRAYASTIGLVLDRFGRVR